MNNITTLFLYISTMNGNSFIHSLITLNRLKEIRTIRLNLNIFLKSRFSICGTKVFFIQDQITSRCYTTTWINLLYHPLGSWMFGKDFNPNDADDEGQASKTHNWECFWDEMKTWHEGRAGGFTLTGAMVNEEVLDVWLDKSSSLTRSFCRLDSCDVFPFYRLND